MSNAAVELKAELRTVQGSRNCEKLRARGFVPAVVYGHGQANVLLSLDAEEVSDLVSTGHRLVSCNTGKGSETLLVKAVQWDFLGDIVQHVDLTRVDLTEEIHTTARLVFKGDAKGVTAGGTLMHEISQLDIVCTAANLPDQIIVNVSNLELDQELRVSDLQLPAGVTTKHDPKAVVAMIRKLKPQAEPTLAAAPTAAEPERIVREKDKDKDADAK